MREASRLERNGISITLAAPTDAQSMALLRYDSLVDFVNKGFMERSPGEVVEERITSADAVRALAESLQAPNDDEYYLIAKNKNGALVGMCGMSWKSREGQFLLKHFYVRPELHNKKVGSSLFLAAKERARRSPHHVRGIYLYVDDFNLQAQNIYMHWGFRKIEAAEGWIKMALSFET